RCLGGARVGKRPLLSQANKGMKLAVDCVHTLKAGLGQLDRRELLCRDQPRGLGNRRNGGAHRRSSSVKLYICAGSAIRPRGLRTRSAISATPAYKAFSSVFCSPVSFSPARASRNSKASSLISGISRHPHGKHEWEA